MAWYFDRARVEISDPPVMLDIILKVEYLLVLTFKCFCYQYSLINHIYKLMLKGNCHHTNRITVNIYPTLRMDMCYKKVLMQP